METKKKHKRKLLNFSIKRDMQLNMIVRISLLLFICLLISNAIFYQFAHQEITASFRTFHIKAQNFLDFLFPVILISFFVSLVAGFVGSLFFPKPLAGGVYRLEEDLKKILADNDWTVTVKLRKGDQLTALATSLNQVVTDGRERLQHSRLALEELEALTKGDIPPEKLQKIINHLGKTNNDLVL